MAKRYKCPYCELRDERKKLITHIDKKHEEMLPEGYDGARIVYDMINHTNGHGTCRICKKDTQWNSSSQRYDILCGNLKCKEAMREEYKKNMLRVKGTYNILNDPEQQQKMLANRKISGKYKYSDGTVFTYTGSYEKKLLEFEDAVMNIPSKDIMMPGPTIEYMYKGEKHFYITDQLYIPYNLIIEIKDGGDNKNGKETPGMIASREKTIEKEKVITDKGEYNYLRLTNNDFVQLIEIFMELKENYINGNDSKVIRVHESYINSSYSENRIIESKSLEFKELLKTINTPKELSNWMKTNIHYKEYDRLMTADEVFDKKKGSCHDQVNFEVEFFKKFNLKYGKEFLIEYNEGETSGGRTHSFIWFTTKGKYYWFENAWNGEQGIHGPYDSIIDIKKEVKEKMLKSSRFNNIEFSSVKNIKPGMTLDEFVTACLESTQKASLSIAESSIDPKVVEIANYINENFIFNEDYFNVKMEPINNNTYLIAEYIIGENSLDTKKLSDSFSMLKERCNTDQYGLCMIKESNNNKYNLYLTDINAFKESVLKGPKKCPECGGKVGVFIQGEPIYKCVECGKFLGVVPCHLGKKKK